MGKPNSDRIQLLVFPAITLSLFLVAVLIGWVFGQVLPSLGMFN